MIERNQLPDFLAEALKRPGSLSKEESELLFFYSQALGTATPEMAKTYTEEYRELRNTRYARLLGKCWAAIKTVLTFWR